MVRVTSGKDKERKQPRDKEGNVRNEKTYLEDNKSVQLYSSLSHLENKANFVVMKEGNLNIIFIYNLSVPFLLCKSISIQLITVHCVN